MAVPPGGGKIHALRIALLAYPLRWWLARDRGARSRVALVQLHREQDPGLRGCPEEMLCTSKVLFHVH
jgi:hypothetical protein